jgi:NADPH2:quinone reductase
MPGPGDVQVRIEAAALGFPDFPMTQGLYQAKPLLPFVPGMECAGVVTALGEEARRHGWREGDRVMAAA